MSDIGVCGLWVCKRVSIKTPISNHLNHLISTKTSKMSTYDGKQPFRVKGNHSLTLNQSNTTPPTPPPPDSPTVAVPTSAASSPSSMN